MNPLTALTPDGILFDLDGTLWDATPVTMESWREVLRDNPGIIPAVPLTLDNIRNYMGLTNEELGAVFFPFLSPAEQMRLMRASCAFENKHLAEHGGVPYPGVMDTLAKLSRKYPLFIVSNCQCGYIECFLGANGAAPYITDYECSDNTKMEKSENIRLIAERNGLKSPIYVGDTTSDSTAAKKADIPFVYAKYGFGEAYGRGRVTDYQYSINSFSELTTLTI